MDNLSIFLFTIIFILMGGLVICEYLNRKIFAEILIIIHTLIKETKGSN